MFNGIFIRQILESFLGKGSYLFFTMIFSFVCTRFYGPEIFGEFTYAFTIVSFLKIFASSGLDKGLIYHIPGKGNRYVSLSFLINFLLSSVIILFAWGFVDNTVLKVMIPLVWLMSNEQIYFGIYRAYGKIKEFYIINGFILMLVQIFLTSLFYFIFGKVTISIIIAVYCSFTVSNLLYFLYNRKKFTRIHYDSKFIIYSLSLVIAALMNVTMNKIDILMLGYMVGNKSVGIYKITTQLANLISIVLVIFNTVFAPRISQLYHQGKMDELKETYIKSTRVLGVLALLFLLVIVLFSRPLLLIFGREFVIGQQALIYRGIGQFVNAAVGSVWLMLSMTGKPRLQLYGNLGAALINIVLNYFLIAKFAMFGAAFASMIAMVFINVLGYVIVSKQFKIKAYGII